MNTLFIDTHGDKIVLAIYEQDKLQKKIEKKDVEHSRICIPSLIELLNQCKKSLEDINEIIVVIGPGSFTGVRIGVTIAKTIAFCKQIPIKTITSLEQYLPVQENYLAIEEKNGYYVGKQTDNQITKYFYLKKSEFEDFIKKEKVYIGDIVDYDGLLKLFKEKDRVNPHQVNPLYVKKIEVENDKKNWEKRLSKNLWIR